MIDEKFVDGVFAARLDRGMLRIDFYSVDIGSKPGVEGEKVPRQRLVMTPQGFAETYAVFTDIMQKMQKAGPAGATGANSGPAPGPQGQPDSGQPSPSGQGSSEEPNASGGPSPNF